MLKLSIVIATAGLAMLAGPAAAQGPQPPAAARVPLLPPVQCRVWYRGLPADRQPRPTDCASARREAALTGGEVVVGTAEPGGAFRIDETADRYRRDADAAHERDRQRELRDRAIDARIRESEERLRCVDVDDC